MERIKSEIESTRTDRARWGKTDPRSRRINRSARAADFAAFADDVHRDLNPRGPLERLLVDHVAQSAWRLKSTLARQLAHDSTNESEPAAPTPSKRTTTTTAADRAARSVREACETLEAVRSRPGSEAIPPRVGVGPVDDRAAIEPPDWSTDPLDDDRPSHPETASANWRDRLIYDFDVSDHSPVVKGTWITVSHVVSLIVDGSTWADILRSHPELTEEDLRVCMAYAVAEEVPGD